MFNVGMDIPERIWESVVFVALLSLIALFAAGHQIYVLNVVKVMF